MDRLQQAVARAEEKIRISGGSRTLESDIANIEYTHTRVDKKSPAELISRHIIAGQSSVPESQIIQVLRTKVLSEMRANNWKTIAVSSPTIGQGKSTIAANLAVAIAMEVTQTALLVDLDLEHPNLHKVFGLEVQAGLADVLQGDAEVPDVMINPGIDRLSIIPGNGTLPNSSEWLSDPSTLSLFAEFRARYKSRYIVYDVPPVMRSDHLLKIASNFDCSLLVLEDGACTADEIRQSVQVMRQTNYLGYVLNKTADLQTLIGARA